jgi:hypothetical protein
VAASLWRHHDELSVHQFQPFLRMKKPLGYKALVILAAETTCLYGLHTHL